MLSAASSTIRMFLSLQIETIRSRAAALPKTWTGTIAETRLPVFLLRVWPP